MDRLEAMSALLAAVEEGSLSAASRKLNVPLATLSRKVSELEAHLRARLVTRGRQLTLTDAGRFYVSACKRILEDIELAERAASGEYSAPRGDLIVTAPVVFGRLHVLPTAIEFLKVYPEINVRLLLVDRIVSLNEETIDIAVRIGELPESALVATRIGEIRQVTCASKSYIAERGVPKNIADLANHDCITFEGLMQSERWSFLVGGQVESVPVRSRLVVNTAESAIAAAEASLGITRVLSYQVEPSLRGGRLALLLKDYEPRAVPISIVFNRQGLLPIKVRAFLDFAAPRLKSRLLSLN